MTAEPARLVPGLPGREARQAPLQPWHGRRRGAPPRLRHSLRRLRGGRRRLCVPHELKHPNAIFVLVSSPTQFSKSLDSPPRRSIVFSPDPSLAFSWRGAPGTSLMYSRDEVKALTDKVLNMAKADAAEVDFTGGERSATRFANSSITANMVQFDQTSRSPLQRREPPPRRRGSSTTMR